MLLWALHQHVEHEAIRVGRKLFMYILALMVMMQGYFHLAAQTPERGNWLGSDIGKDSALAMDP